MMAGLQIKFLYQLVVCLIADHRFEKTNYHSRTMAFLDTTNWDEYPVGQKPVPSSLAELYSSRFAFDPLLSITPEKRVPTLVKLNSTDDVEAGSSLRQTKVHFDQNVAVHQLSPEVSADLSSVMNSSEERNTSPELLLASCGCDRDSDTSSPPIVRINVSSDDHLNISSDDSYRFSPTSDSTGKLNAGETSHNYRFLDSLTKDFNSFGLTDPELDLSLANSTDCEPISIMASDLRVASDSSISRTVGSRVSTGKKSESLTAATVSRSRPGAGLGRSSDVLLEKPRLRTGGLQASASGGAAMGVLARPELNSSRRLTKEMAELRAEGFDRQAILKGNLDPKLKEKIDEKVCC